MNGLSLCSGIGGLDLGLRLAVPDYRTVCYVEYEAFPQDILLARMADGILERAPIWGDLKRFNGRPWRGLVDVVHGGYPCQPFSVAGKRRGTDDERHLWPDVARIVRECEPEWCFFENVAGHLRLGFDVVARDLVDMGYRVACGLFTAAEIGAPHRRERLFMLGDTHSSGLSGRCKSFTGGADEWPAWPPGPEERDWWAAILAERPELAPATADADNNRRAGAPVHLPVWRQGEGVSVADRPSGGLAASAAASQPAVRRVVDGLPHRVGRLKALGNAVVPAVAAHAWRTLSARLMED